MTQKELFEMLGAPLTNHRWSWGAVREVDGAVILRVWKDHVRTHEGREFVQIFRRLSERPGPTQYGQRERLKHVDLIRGGAPCYLIMCEAEDPTERPRRVRRFNAEEVFPGGSVEQRDDDLWVELLPSMPVEQFTSSKPRSR